MFGQVEHLVFVSFQLDVSDLGLCFFSQQLWYAESLDFIAKQDYDLRPIPGMQGGCKWYLCVSSFVDS